MVFVVPPGKFTHRSDRPVGTVKWLLRIAKNPGYPSPIYPVQRHAFGRRIVRHRADCFRNKWAVAALLFPWKSHSNSGQPDDQLWNHVSDHAADTLPSSPVFAEFLQDR